jgi:hypothetical protein
MAEWRARYAEEMPAATPGDRALHEDLAKQMVDNEPRQKKAAPWLSDKDEKK